MGFIEDSFNPLRDEAFESTLPRTNPNLPELRDTAKKYARWQPKRQDSIVINTSAIGRAFPEFSESFSDDSMEIELPRGNNSNHKHQSSNRFYHADYSGSPVVTLGSHIQISTTPKKNDLRSSILQDALRNHARKEAPQSTIDSIQKENMPPSAQRSLKGSPYTSHASRTVSGERRSLSELHAQVADDSESSLFIEQPRITIFQPKTTRFSNKTPNSSAPTQSKKQTSEALRSSTNPIPKVQQVPAKPQAQSSTNLTTNSNTVNPTQHSFLIPGMTETSGEGNGSLNHGVPIYTQDGRVQNRVSSLRTARNASFGPVDGIEVPTDEEDLYLMIDVLRAQVNKLEIENADAQNSIIALKRDRNQLTLEKEQLEAQNRADSALGDSGSDGAYERKDRAMELEISKLQADVISLQSQLTTSERKVSNLELRLKTNSAERDEAMAQNQALKNENASLKAQLSQAYTDNKEHEGIYHKKESTLREQIQKLLLEHEENTYSFQRRESALKDALRRQEDNTVTFQQQESRLQSRLRQQEEAIQNSKASSSALHNRIQRKDDIIRELQEATQQLQETARDIKTITITRTSRKSKGKARSDSRAKDLPTKVVEQAQQQMEAIREVTTDIQSTQSRKQTRGPKPIIKIKNDPIVVEEESFDHDSTGVRSQSDHEASFDVSNYSDEVGHGFMAGVRQSIRDMNTKKREIENMVAEEGETQDETFQTIQSGRSSHAPSMKAASEHQDDKDDTVNTVRSTYSTRAPATRNGILKNSGVTGQEDLTGRLSIKSARSTKSNDRNDTTTRHRSNSHVEEDQTVQSNASHNRRYSESSVHNNRRKIEADEFTSAYLIPDIIAASEKKGKEHPVLSANARRVLDGLCKHNCNNCTICSRMVSFDTKDTTKNAISIEKPIPVSDRMPTPKPYEDEPTIRPSVEPGVALATVIKGLEDEIAHLKIRQSRVQNAYAGHDMSLGKRARTSLKVELEKLLVEIERKSDQLYALYDVLEGQKQAGQEMNIEDDEELPWEGIEESEY